VTRRLRIAWLPDGKRLHLRDGPMDVVLQAFGRAGDIARAYDAAIARMRGILDEVMSELPSPVTTPPSPVHGPIAMRMASAVLPFRDHVFLTPMAAVSGAVADELLAVMLSCTSPERAFVNNGGDIAIHLAPGQHFTMGMIDHTNRSCLPSKFSVDSAPGGRGLATSRWSGPGHSFGIADAVTVCAASSAAADAACTLICNAVDLPGHKSISRAPANTLDPRSDLGERLVTTRVGALSVAEKVAALAGGVALAEQYCAAGLIEYAVLSLQDEVAVVRLEGVSRALVLERAAASRGTAKTPV